MFQSRSFLSLCVLVCLSLGLLFSGCENDPDNGSTSGLNTDLIGTWLETNEFGTDGYAVETNRVRYISDWFSFTGSIRHVTNFSNSAGVIIIEYDSQYINPDVNFIGIYFRNLNPGVSVQMGVAWIEEGAEEPTLNAAMAAFTSGNEGKYMSFYGTYLWSTD